MSRRLEIDANEDESVAVESDCASVRMHDSTTDIEERVKRLLKKVVRHLVLHSVDGNDECIAFVLFLCELHEFDETLAVHLVELGSRWAEV